MKIILQTIKTMLPSSDYKVEDENYHNWEFTVK